MVKFYKDKFQAKAVKKTRFSKKVYLKKKLTLFHKKFIAKAINYKRLHPKLVNSQQDQGEKTIVKGLSSLFEKDLEGQKL